MFNFAGRRRRFLEAIGGGVAILSAAPVRFRSRDVEHRYRQDSDFFYLTGFPEPEAVAVFRPGVDPEYILFVRPRDPSREAWDGERVGEVGAVERYGAGAAFPVSELKEQVSVWLRQADRLYVRTGRDPRIDRVLESVLAERNAAPPILDPAGVVHPMRLRKEREEIEAVSTAAAISVEAHYEAATAIAPGRYEYEIEAVLEAAMRRRGAAGPAYPTIVASGPNATTLHYTANRRRIADGDPVLIDAGAENQMYAADIARTWPASGRFSESQREVYQIVLAAQRAAIGRCRAGATYGEVHEEAHGILCEGVRRLAAAETAEEAKRFTIHRTGHWLGLDVHDVGGYEEGGQPRRLEPGMVLTIEPGLYFRRDAGSPARYEGIGVRIEDDVLVTEHGPRVLTDGLPKEAEEVEELVSHR